MFRLSFSGLIYRATTISAGIYKTTCMKTLLEVGKEWKAITVGILVDVEGNLPPLAQMRFRSDPTPHQYFQNTPHQCPEFITVLSAHLLLLGAGLAHGSC